MSIRFHDLPASARPNCAACPFAVEGKPPHAPVMGTCLRPEQTSGVLIGESPGGDEVDDREVFKGRTGKWLDTQLVAAKLDRGDLTIINAIGCQPGKGLKTDTNMGKAASACWPMFEHQYAPYRKHHVLAMGKWASYAANGQSPVTIETGRGFIRPRRQPGASLIVTWHPTYAAFYNPWKAGEFINDLQRFQRLLNNQLELAPKTRIRASVSDVERLARQSGGWLACDIETRAPPGEPPHLGKDPTRADLRTIALGTPDLGISYWWGSDQQVQAAIVKVLHNEKIMKVFHNGHFFDLRVLERYGVRPAPVIDTRDMRRAVSATSRLSLRFLASVYSDFAPWKEDEK